MKQWYEIDTELLEKEKVEMSKSFPQFKLEILDDGRLSWIGEIQSPFNKCSYIFMVAYMSNINIG